MLTIAPDTRACVINLPCPEQTHELAHLLKRRCSTREFLPDVLPLQTLSTLLWSAFGVNRPASDGRTAPSAHNWREIDLYAVMAEGTYRYEAQGQRLVRINGEDLRALTGLQDFAASAPLNLLYVADFDKMTGAPLSEREFLAGVAAGCIVQNVYLACSAAGLGTVVRALIDRGQLAKALGLPVTQRILLAQTVGLPR
jgi:SagB-type dehydrogenase family enzyme